MKRLLGITAAVVVGALLTVTAMDSANAKRLGSGGSFGSKFSQSQPLKNKSTGSPQGKSAQQQNVDRKQQLASKGGLMGALGALAIGGLLGALLFGGAFENFNLFDLLIFGLIGFLIYKFFASRARPAQPATAGAYGDAGIDLDDSAQTRESQNYSAAGGSAAPSATTTSAHDGKSVDELRTGVPKGFDNDDFLAGAKERFTALQRAWDTGDLAEIRQFTTDHVFGELQDQFRAQGKRSNTEVLDLQGEVLGAKDLGSKTEVAVLFAAQLREDGDEVNAREVWHFVRANGSRRAVWLLEGIQQVEDS